MDNESCNKFTWVIRNFFSLGSERIYSDPFVINGCRWRLLAVPKGNMTTNDISLFLVVADFKSLPLGWRRLAKFSLTIILGKSSQRTEAQIWYDEKSPAWGFAITVSLTRLPAGFRVNGELKVVAEVNVLEVIGRLNVSKESEETTNKPVKKIKLNDDGAASSSVLHKATLSFDGVQVLPSLVESMNHLFGKHPDIASEFRSKNPNLRKGFMNLLLSLTQMLCQSPQELSHGDLSDASVALVYLKESGLTLDWLEEKLDEVKEKKKKEEACLARLQETEEKLKPLKQKCLEFEAQVEKEKAELLEARAPLSFEHFVFLG